jgi:NADH-quinone oxidoreductase subunit L
VDGILWLIPALPLAGFVLLLGTGKRLGDPLAGLVATAMTAASFVVCIVVFAGLLSEDGAERVYEQRLFEWIPAGGFSVDVGFLADPLSVTWVLVVTGIAALIHLYSIGYMRDDPRFHTFFAYLNLFVFSMLVLVLGNNLLLTFLGWEGVGACSYFLISFWFEKKENATAGKKAFVTNRIGDWGFLVAMFLTFFTFGSLNYTEFLPAAPGIAATTATALALLFFVGAVGKSAQLPLFVWLPDAMAGPTPVSALIHAATMVTAGVYLMVRINPILAASHDEVGIVIAWIGGATALVAATIAVAQNDIKRVLAYSTVSQLGFMFMAVGTGVYVAAVFHVITHAFFKGLLFLGSGSVIHGMAGEQDMRRMGGLARWLPVTHATFFVGVIAIAGIPPFAGFWSKDDILLADYDFNIALVLLGIVAALLTAFYMARQYFLVFRTSPRWGAHSADAPLPQVGGEPEGGDAGADASVSADAHDAPGHGDHLPATHPDFHPHESGWLMTLPLIVLATLSVVGGLLNLPFTSDLKLLEHWLVAEEGWSSIPFEHHVEVDTGVKITLAVLSALTAVAGVVAAYIFFQRRREPVDALEPEVLREAWFIDKAYAAAVAGPGRLLFEAAAWFDRTIIDGAVRGAGRLAQDVGQGLRATQNGLVRSYALAVAVGAFLMVGYVLTRMS